MSTDTSKKRLKISFRPPVKPGSFGGPPRIIVTTLAVFVLSQIIGGLAAGIFLGIRGQGMSLDNSAAAQFIYLLFAEGLAAAFILMVIKERGLKPKAIGLGRRPRWNDLGRAVLAFIAFYGILIVLTVIVDMLVPSVSGEKQDVGFNNIVTLSDNIFAFISLVILPPIGEETLIRGYLYSGLRSKWRYAPAMLLTSVLFAAAHLSGTDSGLLWSGALDTFVLSIVLVYLRETTGALYAGMMVHALNNLVAFAYHFH